MENRHQVKQKMSGDIGRWGALFCVLVCAGLLLDGCALQPRQSVALEGRLPISVAAVATAGSLIPVTVGPVVATAGTPVTLVVTGSYGPGIYQAAFHYG